MLFHRSCQVLGLRRSAGAALHWPGLAARSSSTASSSGNDKDDEIPSLRDVSTEAQQRKLREAGVTPGIDVTNSEQVHAVGRRLRSRRTMDDIYAVVLEESLKNKDEGKRVSADDVYKRTQERLYEEEHGRKPPSHTDFQVKYMPWGPDFELERLEKVSYTENDPWPDRAVTPENPVYNINMVESADAETAAAMNDAEVRMYHPRKGFDPRQEFSDAVDELGHWEMEFLAFVREVPLWQRRTLPLLHEHYRNIAHRVRRAEKRFVHCRNAALAPAKAGSAAYTATEAWIERIRKMIAETHKSLATRSYDPLKMKKSVLGKLLRMTSDDFEFHKIKEKEKRNNLIAEFNGE